MAPRSASPRSSFEGWEVGDPPASRLQEDVGWSRRGRSDHGRTLRNGLARVNVFLFISQLQSTGSGGRSRAAPFGGQRSLGGGRCRWQSHAACSVARAPRRECGSHVGRPSASSASRCVSYPGPPRSSFGADMGTAFDNIMILSDSYKVRGAHLGLRGRGRASLQAQSRCRHLFPTLPPNRRRHTGASTRREPRSSTRTLSRAGASSPR